MCVKQYIFATEFYISSIMAIISNVIIYSYVRATIYGKYFLDGLNEVDKKCLKKSIFRIIRPEEKHTKHYINDHTATPNGATTLAL